MEEGREMARSDNVRLAFARPLPRTSAAVGAASQDRVDPGRGCRADDARLDNRRLGSFHR